MCVCVCVCACVCVCLLYPLSVGGEGVFVDDIVAEAALVCVCECVCMCVRENER